MRLEERGDESRAVEEGLLLGGGGQQCSRASSITPLRNTPYTPAPAGPVSRSSWKLLLTLISYLHAACGVGAQAASASEVFSVAETEGLLHISDLDFFIRQSYLLFPTDDWLSQYCINGTPSPPYTAFFSKYTGRSAPILYVCNDQDLHIMLIAVRVSFYFIK